MLIVNELGNGSVQLEAKQGETVESRSANLPKNVSKEEMKKEINKPLYLNRYE